MYKQFDISKADVKLMLKDLMFHQKHGVCFMLKSLLLKMAKAVFYNRMLYAGVRTLQPPPQQWRFHMKTVVLA